VTATRADTHCHRQSGKSEQTKFIVQAIPNAALKELFVQMDSDVGCKVTCDVRTIKEDQIDDDCIYCYKKWVCSLD